METERQVESSSWLRSPAGLMLCLFLAIAAFFLLTEHRATHLFGALPWLLFLACPLLHLLHGGHGHGGQGCHANHGESRPNLRRGDQS